LTLINNYFVICATQWDVQDKNEKRPPVEVVPVMLCMRQQHLLFDICFWSVVWSVFLENRLTTPEVLQCRQHEVWDLYDDDDYGALLSCGLWCV